MILPSRGKKSPPKQICVDQPPPGRLFGTRFRAQTRDLPPRVIRFPHLQRRERPTSVRHARSNRRAGLASGHAPRRAGPEPGDAALAGRGRGRHHGCCSFRSYASFFFFRPLPRTAPTAELTPKPRAKAETAAKGSSSFERIAEIKAAQHPADGFLVSFYLDTKTILGFDDFEFANHFFHRTVSQELGKPGPEMPNTLQLAQKSLLGGDAKTHEKNCNHRFYCPKSRFYRRKWLSTGYTASFATSGRVQFRGRKKCVRPL